MRNRSSCLSMAATLVLTVANNLSAQNPIITDQFTADPAARVFEGRIYLYPSHDILAGEGRGRAGWFCMEDYHVFSSENLVDWADHGVIVSQEKVPWVSSKSYAMWAPDCIYRNGKYYFYFPAPARDTTYGRGFSIGVAVSDKPYRTVYATTRAHQRCPWHRSESIYRQGRAGILVLGGKKFLRGKAERKYAGSGR